MIKLIDILVESALEEKKDRCHHIADRRYDKPSAYKSGAIVRCRQGKIWKKLKETSTAPGADWYRKLMKKYDLPSKSNPISIKPNEYKIISSEEFNKKYVDDTLKKASFGTKYKKDIVTDINHYGEGQYWCASENCIEHYRENPNYIDEDEISLPSGLKIAIGDEDAFYDYENEIRKNADGFYNPEMDTYGLVLFKKKLKEDESLRKWFGRRGAAGGEGGWVDCNTCRKVDGKTKCKSCGRKKGEKRAKYPSCRPTPSACKQKGKGKSWGKTK